MNLSFFLGVRLGDRTLQEYADEYTYYSLISNKFVYAFIMPRLGGVYRFRRVRSQRKSVDWGTMGPALGGAYECYAHISSLSYFFLVVRHGDRNLQALMRKKC